MDNDNAIYPLCFTWLIQMIMFCREQTKKLPNIEFGGRID